MAAVSRCPARASVGVHELGVGGQLALVHLQRRLGVPTPRYAHLPLLLDARGAKLGKSLGAAAVDVTDPLPALRSAWTALGQDAARLPAHHSPRAFLDAALAVFDPQQIPRVDLVIANTIS